MKSSVVRIVLILLILGKTAEGQQIINRSDRLKLNDVIEKALSNHPKLVQAQIEIDTAEARITKARSWFFPQVDLGGIAKQGLSGAGNALGIKGVAASPFPDDAAISANASQVLFDFGRIKHGTAARRYELTYLKESIGAKRAEIILKSIQAFFQVLQGQELKRVRKKTLEEKKLILKQSEVFYRAQLKSRLDVRLAETNLSKAQLALDHSSYQVKQTIAKLENAMGLASFSSDYVLEEPEIEVVSPASLKELLAEALEHRAELKAIRARIKAQEHWLRKAKSEKYPQLKAAFSGGWARFADLSLSNLLFGGFGIQLPIFMGNRIKANIEETKLGLEKTKAISTLLANDVQLKVKQTYNDLLASRESVAVNQMVTVQVQKAMSLARVRYQLDLADFVELTTAENSLAIAQSDHSQSLYKYKIKESELKYEIGHLNN